MCLNWKSLFCSEMKVCYITQVLKQCINIKTMCLNYKCEFRNTKSHLLAWAKIETVIENNVC